MRARDDDLIEVAPAVRSALAEGRPVVALESTIITHGMPYPANLEMAVAVEAIARGAGAAPATIAIIDGRIRVGIGEADLGRLAQARDARKASRRDLAALVATGATAGTTVAATMVVAARCGIAVFGTGGIGGVHYGAEETFDISADLIELGRTPVAVVAGIKSILDIGKTLEVLETQGVPVLGFGTQVFPAFFARESDHKVDYRVDTPRAVADIIHAQQRLGIQSGMLIANPVPAEHALPAADMDVLIADACRDADAAGVSRKEVTPFLLARVNALTGGASLRANIALVKSNVELAARIAVEHAALVAGPAAPGRNNG
ncbi:MAG TPA: pseudouridine-5'-phosphate glycosidase [Vineibacter sp.]|nr:pseudouridine-5'-phosphate glycosidase [Vineibacter sp.]